MTVSMQLNRTSRLKQLLKRGVFSLSVIVCVIGTLGCDIVIQNGNPQQSVSVAPTVTLASSRIDSIRFGETETVSQTRTETVRNCSGGITSLKVSYAAVVGNGVQWTVGAQAGVGTTIGGGVLPGGVDLTVELSGAIAPELITNSEQSVAYELSSAPNTIMEYDILWENTWQTATLDVSTPTGEIKTVVVRFVSDINSNIVGERLRPCTSSNVTATVVTNTPETVQQAPTVPPVSQPTTINVTAALQSVTQTPIRPLIMVVTATREQSLVSACPPTGSPDALFTEALSFDNQTYNRGTGVFSQVGIPIGNQASEYRLARDAFDAYPCIQMINPGSLLDGQNNRHCRVSAYNTNRIWAGAVLSGISLEVRQANTSSFEVIGVMTQIAPDARSYMIDYTLHVGDEICLVTPSGVTMQSLIDKGGYLVMFGRDLMHFADSWCVLRENDDSSHYCIDYGI